MATRKKRKQSSPSGGGMKSFLVFVLIVAGAVWFYQSQHNGTDFPKSGKIESMVTETIDKAKEQVPEKLKEIASKAEDLKEKQTETTQKKTEEKPLASPSVKPSDKLEIPVALTKRNDPVLKRSGYTASYNLFYKNPNWVAWELTRRETKGMNVRINRFSPDPNLPEPRVTHSDYTHSGYDRGHMAPAADMKWSQQAMLESFYMSNVCPQNQKLNRDDWNDLEETCRMWAKKYGAVYIACGPIYDLKKPKRIGERKVAVPDRFFKVVLINDAKNPVAMGFIFPNKANHQKLEKYMHSVDAVEKITGLDFFSKLPDSTEKRIEAIIPPPPATR